MTGMYDSIPATPDEVRVFAQDISDAYLHCRVWGHDPTPHNINVAKDIEGVKGAHWDATLRCSHDCGVRWRVLASNDGTVLRRRLDYSAAPDYISPTGRIDAEGRKVLRQQFFVRRTDKKG